MRPKDDNNYGKVASMTVRHAIGEMMKPLHVVAAALAATSLWVAAAESVSKLPAPWVVAGKQPASYQIGIDNLVTVSGKGAKFIRYAQGDNTGWGTLMQQVSAERYRGQRVRFQAKVKTLNVNDWAGLWMRIDVDSQSVALYNSQDKPINGTTDWQTRSVVLDVPADGTVLAFGVINSGTGQVWIDELSLEPVGKDVPVDAPARKKLPDRPVL